MRDLRNELFIAADICRNNARTGPRDERDAWTGMAARLRELSRLAPLHRTGRAALSQSQPTDGGVKDE